MNNNKFDEFIIITTKLNEIGITPLLMGSVGLEVVTRKNWDAGDLDIHVPGDERGWEVPPDRNINNWPEIEKLMIELGYQLVDLHEHEFTKEGLSVEFGIMDTLPSFAGVALDELELQQTNGAQYYLLNPVQYLRVYEASSKDSYRADQNNNKDFSKIEYLKRILGSNIATSKNM